MDETFRAKQSRVLADYLLLEPMPNDPQATPIRETGPSSEKVWFFKKPDMSTGAPGARLRFFKKAYGCQIAIYLAPLAAVDEIANYLL